MKYIPISFFFLTSIFLSACGSSSEESEAAFPNAYLQFYNGYANGATTYIGEVDGGILGNAAYGDSTSLLSFEQGEIELEFFRIDADNQIVEIENASVGLNAEEKVLFILSGASQTPSINEYRFERQELDNHFRLFVTSVIDDQQSYDVYMSEAGEPFSAANFLGSIGYQQFDEMSYWDPESESAEFDQGEYIIYLAEPGQDTPLFESPTIDFFYNTEYVLALRNTAGALKDNIEIDLIINSTSVARYADEEASSQFRVHNTLDDTPLNLTLNGNATQSSSVNVLSNSISDFVRIDFGDYRLSATSNSGQDSFNNRLVTLNQGQSKAIILFKDEEEKLTSMSFNESSLPQIFDHQIQVANVAPGFFDIDFYFVRKDETIDTAEYRILGLDFAENRSITIPGDFYELIAVHDENNDTQVLLDKTELLSINEQANYIITIEKTLASPTGYKISVLY